MLSSVRIYGEIVEITQYEKTPLKRPRKYIRSEVREGFTVLKPRRLDSLKRSKQILVRKVHTAIEQFGAPILVTLTFRGEAFNIYDASSRLGGFFKRLRNLYPQAHAIAVPEVSPRGRVHFHCLVFSVSYHKTRYRPEEALSGGFPDNHNSRDCVDCPYYALWGQHEGFADYRATDGSPRLASYLTKYLTKHAFNPLLIGVRLVRHTKNFPTHLEVKGVLADKIAEVYSKNVPDHEWQRDTMFHGRMRRAYYKLKT